MSWSTGSISWSARVRWILRLLSMKFQPIGLGPTVNTSARCRIRLLPLLLSAFALAGILEAQKSFQIQPLRPVEELRREAMQAKPPVESGNFRTPDLVDLATLGADFHFEIRYATANNFLGTPVYPEARAFLERPAADALVAAA